MQKNYIKAVGKGIMKVMSKMGISTYQSYCGAQIFDAVGLSTEFIEKYFTGTATTIEGVGLSEIAEESVRRHRDAYGDNPIYRNMLDVGGDYAFRLRGEDHAWTPESVSRLQHAVRGNNPAEYQLFAKEINEQSERLLTLRGLMEFQAGRTGIPLDRGRAGGGHRQALLHRSDELRLDQPRSPYQSRHRHEPHRRPLQHRRRRRGARPLHAAGQWRFHAFGKIKQVASGRFGVTAEYLVNADDIQIKMAQGAKPGEGGQLPGHKVDKSSPKCAIPRPGVGLISPPPHHDIYSIEDLAQLIRDLKSVNRKARISVKLVSEVGVGTVAAGVAKCRADHVTISGFEGGTGASPLTSLTHAGSPWEIGLAETQQTLVLNGLARPHRGPGRWRPPHRP